MYTKANDLSELEQEFELEMDDLEAGDDFEFEGGEDSEHDDYEAETEYEDDAQGEYEWLGASGSGYAERFFELSQREFESESEIDDAVNEILDDMEREYFFGGLLKKAKGVAQSLAKKGVALAKKAGINLPSIDALKSMLGPISGLLKGNLGSLIKPALKAALSAHPAGMAALPALKALGFESSEDMGENREAWNNYASVAQEAFEHLAANLNENADHPLEASRLATNAFQAGLRNVQNKGGFAAKSSNGRSTGRDHRKKKARYIYLEPGEVVVIKVRK
jgi:hypothetical protein